MYKCGLVGGETLRLRKVLTYKKRSKVINRYSKGSLWTVIGGDTDIADVVWLYNPDGERQTWDDDSIFEWFEVITTPMIGSENTGICQNETLTEASLASLQACTCLRKLRDRQHINRRMLASAAEDAEKTIQEAMQWADQEPNPAVARLYISSLLAFWDAIYFHFLCRSPRQMSSYHQFARCYFQFCRFADITKDLVKERVHRTWPQTPGMTLSFTDGKSALELARKYFLKMRRRVHVATDKSGIITRRYSRVKLSFPPDPEILVLVREVINEFQNRPIGGHWTLAEIQQNAQRIDGLIHDEYRRYLNV